MKQQTGDRAKPAADDEQQRRQLDRSFEHATEDQPKEYRNESIEDKQVEIGADKTADPIKGLDTPEKKSDKR